MNILLGERVKLRPLEPDDVDLLYKWENNPEIWRISNTLVPFSKNILKRYLESSTLDIFETKQLRLIIEIINPYPKAIGTIDLFDFDPFHLRAGIGILIAEKNERQKGYADDSLKLLIEYSSKHLQLKQLYCNIETDNNESINLFEKNGFEISGEKKSWLKTTSGWKNEYLLQLIFKDI